MIRDDKTTPRWPVRWTRLVLHFADGSGLVSAWDEARSCAVQNDAGAGRMTEANATAEHLRALAELRETGGCTNWFARMIGSGEDPPPLDTIDWTGFESPDPEG